MLKSVKDMDRRVERSRAKVLAETYRQLTQSGINGVSVDEISRISRISKTTIYRHWPSRAALLLDACRQLGSAPEPPNTGTFRGDLLALMAGLTDQLQAANWSSIYPSIIDAAERDPEIKAVQKAMHNGFMAPFYAVIERARLNQEISSNRTTSEFVAALVGPLFFRRWFSKEKIDRRFLRTIIESAVR